MVHFRAQVHVGALQAALNHGGIHGKKLCISRLEHSVFIELHIFGYIRHHDSERSQDISLSVPEGTLFIYLKAFISGTDGAIFSHEPSYSVQAQISFGIHAEIALSLIHI